MLFSSYDFAIPSSHKSNKIRNIAEDELRIRAEIMLVKFLLQSNFLFIRFVISPDKKSSHSFYQRKIIQFLSKPKQLFFHGFFTTSFTKISFQFLSDAAPQLVYKFIEQTIQPGPSVSLKCIATGNPTPHFTWTLDGFPLPQNDR